MRFVAVVLLTLLAVPLSAEETPMFPPIGDRYDNLPDDAKSVLKTLKKLQARTEIGINFVDYDKAVSEAYPDVKVFVESPESRTLPELRVLLSNTMDCYLKVREVWSAKVSADDAVEKYDASINLIALQPILWKVASANIAGAAALMESPKEGLAEVQKTVVAGLPKLTVRHALALAQEELRQLERHGRAKASGCPIPDPSPEVDTIDIGLALSKTGELGASLTRGEFNSQVPQMFSRVPPANVEGEVPLFTNEQRQGGLTAFIYADPAVARKAFETLCKSMGRARKPIEGLGVKAEAILVDRLTDVVFRRGGAVVYARLPIPDVNAAVEPLRQLDSYLATVIPAVDEPPEELPVAEPPAAELEEPPFESPAPVAKSPAASTTEPEKANTPKQEDAPPPRIRVVSADHVDVAPLIKTSEKLAEDGGPAARYAKTLLGLVKTKEWKRKAEDSKPIKGLLVKVSANNATFETKSGMVTVPIPELAAESGTKVKRIEDMCRRIVSLEPEAALLPAGE